MDYKRFKLYRSGIYLGDVCFYGNSIMVTEKDIFSNTWCDSAKYDLEENPYKEMYSMDLPQIDRLLHRKEVIDFPAVQGFSIEDRQYSKYQTVSSANRQLPAYIWAERKRQFPMDIITYDSTVVGFIVTKREECIILVQEKFEEFTPLRLWSSAQVSKAEYGIKGLGVFMVPMRDGVRLATEVWLPDAANTSGKYPVVFVRTPYGRKSSSLQYFRFVQRGYGLVIQDVRGRDDSEGVFESQACERPDGDDSLTWLAEQDWCDGSIGMIGGSYLGYVQWAAASSGNPNLKAIISIVTAGSPFADFPRKGGAMASGILAWLFSLAEKRFKPEAMIREDWDEVLNIRPIADIPQKTLGRNIPMWDEYLRHEINDGFWESMNWSIHGDKIDVPALLMSGWFDDNGPGTLEAWNMNARHGREHTRMILGPWLHKANTTRDIGEISLGNNAIRYDLDLLFLKWFDKHLKGMENGVEQQPAVEYYQQGADEWRFSDSWTPNSAVRKSIYLGSSGKANSSSGDGSLEWQFCSRSDYDTFIYDPENPVPHLIDVSANELNVPADYKGIEERQDVLVYTSEPLEEDLSIAGEVFAELYAESTAKDTDWVVRLTDVDGEGNSRRLVDGLYRASYINDFREKLPLREHEIRKYRVGMFHTANTFKKGHRIRIEITSSAKNLVFPNHNTGEDFTTAVDYVKATQKVYHSKEYVSFVSLPVMNAKEQFR